MPETEDDVVERFAFLRECAVNGVSRFSVHLFGDEPVDDRAAFRTAQPDDREGGDAGRRAERDDGVGGHFTSGRRRRRAGRAHRPPPGR